MVSPIVTPMKRKNGLSKAISSNAIDDAIKDKKKKKPRVTVKTEFNVEIPSDIITVIPATADTSQVHSSSSSSFSSLSFSSSSSSSSVLHQEEKTLPSISSLLLYKPTIDANKFDPFCQSIEPYAQYPLPAPAAPMHQPTTVKYESVDAPGSTMVMPIIPYYFHHHNFGIEACMHQLEHHRQQQDLKAYSINPVKNGVNCYYHI